MRGGDTEEEHGPLKRALYWTFGRIGDWAGNACSQAGFAYVDHMGLGVAWECATPKVADNTLQRPMRQVEEQMIVLSDTAFHAAEGDPTALKRYPCGAGSPAGEDGALEANRGLSFQKGHAPRVEILLRLARVHYGGLQYVGPVAWLPALCGWLRASLDG